MLIFLENLEIIEGTTEEIYLIPYPRYINIKNTYEMKILQHSKLFTDLSEEFNYIIEELQDALLSKGLDERLGVTRVQDLDKYPKIRLFMNKKKDSIPETLYKETTTNKNYKDQGYLLIAQDSNLIIEANSIQGMFYGVQTFIQLLNSSQNKLSIKNLLILDFLLIIYFDLSLIVV